jgi:hypothetical protein
LQSRATIRSEQIIFIPARAPARQPSSEYRAQHWTCIDIDLPNHQAREIVQCQKASRGAADRVNKMPRLPITMRFGAIGDYKLWAGEGWHHDANEKGHVWAGPTAKLRLMLEYPKNDILLQVDVIPVQAAGVDQELFVFLNGTFVAFWNVASATEKSARIESNFFASGENLLTFVAPKAMCPRERGISNDQRILGVAFRSLSLSNVP